MRDNYVEEIVSSWEMFLPSRTYLFIQFVILKVKIKDKYLFGSKAGLDKQTQNNFYQWRVVVSLASNQEKLEKYNTFWSMLTWSMVTFEK